MVAVTSRLPRFLSVTFSIGVGISCWVDQREKKPKRSSLEEFLSLARDRFTLLNNYCLQGTIYFPHPYLSPHQKAPKKAWGGRT